VEQETLPTEDPKITGKDCGATSAPEASETESSKAAAFLLGLPLHLKLVLDSESHRTHVQLVSGQRFYQTSAEHLLQYLPWYVGFALGIYVALISGYVLIACIILANWFAILKQHWAIGKAAVNGGIQCATQRISMVITEEGFCETDRGVESRVGWTAMNQWYLWRAILFIELTNGHWAVIPSKHMEPTDVSLEALTSYLKIKGIPGQKLKDA